MLLKVLIVTTEVVGPLVLPLQFISQPADKAVSLDGSGDVTLTGANQNLVWDKSDDQL